MTEHRWSKFWWQDWQADQALRSCSLAARGLWMDMLCIAHTGTPRGYVTINGHPVPPKRLATMSGTTEKECTRLLAELQEAGVFSRTEAGIIYSRRMVRDTEQSDAGREAVGKRWAKAGKPTSHPNTPPNRGATGEPSTQEAESEAEADTTLAGGSARTRARAGAPLPEGWQPIDRAAPPLDHAAVLARFSDWHRAHGTTAADWDAKWRLWLADEAKRPKPPLHTQPQAEQDRRILAAAGALGFADPPPLSVVPLRIAQ